MRSQRNREREQDMERKKNLNGNGINKLRERICKEEVVCYETDKGGRWVIDTVSNY